MPADPRLGAGLGVLLLATALAVGAPLVATHDPVAQPDVVATRYSPRSRGTDSGRSISSAPIGWGGTSGAG